MSISEAFLNKATLWGEAPFTTMLCCRGNILFKEQHLKRLEKTIDEVYSGKELVSTLKRIETAIDSIAKEYVDSSHTYMRVTLFQELSGALEFFIWSFDREPSSKCLSLSLTPHVGANDYSSVVKKSDYSYRFRKRESVVEEGFDDLLFYDAGTGSLLDTTTANLFGIKDDVVIKTDISSGVLDGICAQALLRYLSLENIPYKISSILKSELLSYDEFFVTDAFNGIRAVSRIEDVDYSTRQVQELIKKFSHYNGEIW